jgi:hypothetical protein
MPKLKTKGFRLVGWKWGQLCAFGKWGTINLDTLTEKQAASLIAKGFPYLKATKKAKPEETE